MRKATSKFTTAAGIALVALMSTLSFSSATSAAEGVRKNNSVSVNIGERRMNRGDRLRNRNFGENRFYGNNNYGRRHRNFSEYSDYGDNNYRRYNRRNRGFGFGGISINLGSIDSGCRYSYRKWQNTGSRYWRRQYYDCIG
jgi:hypothetical protein